MAVNTHTYFLKHTPSVQSSRHDSEVCWEVLLIGELLALRCTLLFFSLFLYSSSLYLLLTPLLPQPAHLFFLHNPILNYHSSIQWFYVLILLSFRVFACCFLESVHIIHLFTALNHTSFTVLFGLRLYRQIKKKRQTILFVFIKLFIKLKFWYKRGILCVRELSDQSHFISAATSNTDSLYIQPQICSCCHLWVLLSSERGPSSLDSSLWHVKKKFMKTAGEILYALCNRIFCATGTFSMCNKSGKEMQLNNCYKELHYHWLIQYRKQKSYNIEK